MRLATLVVVLLMTACAEHGSGTTVDTFARLPVASGYTIGFDRDGTPLLGFMNQFGPIARASGGNWLPASQESVRVFGFGADNDGTPIAVYQDMTQGVVIASFSNGTLTPLGDPIAATPFAVVQHGDGTRYAIAGGFAMRLAPGATTWTVSNIDMQRAVVAPDGSLLAWTTSQGLVRVGANDAVTPIIACNALGPNGCGGSQFGGVDASGRMYFATFEGVRAFDPGDTIPIRIDLPQSEQPINMITTPELSIVAAFGAEAKLYALSPGAAAVAAIRLTEPLATSSQIGLHTSGDGKIYVSHTDWLGLAAQIGGDD